MTPPVRIRLFKTQRRTGVMQMTQQLKQIYGDLSNGRLSQADALARIKAIKLRAPRDGTGALLITPAWQARGVEASAGASHVEYAEHHVVLCEIPKVNAGKLGPCFRTAIAWRCKRGSRERCPALQRARARVFRADPDDPPWQAPGQGAGPDRHRRRPGARAVRRSVGIAKAATLENPQFIGSAHSRPGRDDVRGIWPAPAGGEGLGAGCVIKYDHGARHALDWQEVAATRTRPRSRSEITAST